MRRNGEVHPADLRRPALRPDCVRYHDAFCALGAGRLSTQVGPSPIQITEVNTYLDMLGIEDPETKLKYLRLIRKMDRVELNYIYEKTKK